MSVLLIGMYYLDSFLLHIGEELAYGHCLMLSDNFRINFVSNSYV